MHRMKRNEEVPFGVWLQVLLRSISWPCQGCVVRMILLVDDPVFGPTVHQDYNSN
jgi:glucose dehydrogenase